MSLLNTKTGFTTPWHCSVALMLDGEWMSAPMGDFQKQSSMKVIYEDGRPSYFQEIVVDGNKSEKTERGSIKKENDNLQRLNPSSSPFNVSGWLQAVMNLTHKDSERHSSRDGKESLANA